MATWTKTITGDWRQGSYNGTRHTATLDFSITDIDLTKKNITSATLTLVATASGKDANRSLFLRQGSTTGSYIYQSGTTLYNVGRGKTNTLNLVVSDITHLNAITSGKFYLNAPADVDDYYFTDSTGKKYSGMYTRFTSATLTVEYEDFIGKYYTGGAWKNIVGAQYYTNGAWKVITDVKLYTNSVWK